MTIPRGTSNTNVRGSSTTRRRRREWLVEHYRADVDLLLTPIGTVFGSISVTSTDESWIGVSTRHNACRCYRCATLLTVDTLTVDRIIPGCQGGTYKRSNIRPACQHCNSEVGGALRSAPRQRVSA